MNWNPEVLKTARELKTNCIDFIYACTEHVANRRGHTTVDSSDLETALEFVNGPRESVGDNAGRSADMHR